MGHMDMNLKIRILFIQAIKRVSINSTSLDWPRSRYMQFLCKKSL